MFVEQALARETECVRAQRHPVTSCVYSAVDVITALVIVDLVAVADVQPVLGAVPPNCVLHEPREDFWKTRVELASINSLGDSLDNVGGEANRVRTKQISAIIPLTFRRFGQAINMDKVFGTHTRITPASTLVR